MQEPAPPQLTDFPHIALPLLYSAKRRILTSLAVAVSALPFLVLASAPFKYVSAPIALGAALYATRNTAARRIRAIQQSLAQLIEPKIVTGDGVLAAWQQYAPTLLEMQQHLGQYLPMPMTYGLGGASSDCIRFNMSGPGLDFALALHARQDGTDLRMLAIGKSLQPLETLLTKLEPYKLQVAHVAIPSQPITQEQPE